MAYKIKSTLMADLFVFTILLALAGQAIAMRDIPEQPNNADVKHPEWLIEPNHKSKLIPGIGRVILPPKFKTHHHYKPYTGGIPSVGGGSMGGGSTGGGWMGGSPTGGGSMGGGSTGGGWMGGGPTGGGSVGGGSTGGGSTGRYIPGGDDTLVPNPGFEVPNPSGGGGGVPHP